MLPARGWNRRGFPRAAGSVVNAALEKLTDAVLSARGGIGRGFLLAEAARGAHGPPFDPTTPKQASGYRSQHE
jgi:hypothetical protein